MKRKISETVNNVATLYTYDAAGKVVQVTRQSADGSQTVLAQTAYDLTGRVTSEINALGIVTTYAYTIDGQSQRVKTITYAFGTADPATRIETYAQDGTIVKVAGSAVIAPVRYEYGVEQDGGVYRTFEKKLKLDANGNDTLEWTKTDTDMAGRVYKTLYSASSGTPSAQWSYKPSGQLDRQADPDGVTTLFAYNSKGELQDSVLDTNRDNAIDLGGLDRVTRTIRDVVGNATYGCNVERTRVFDFPKDNNGAISNEISRVERSVDGLRTWKTRPGLSGMSVVTWSQTAYNPGAGIRTETSTAADGSYVAKQYVNGRLSSITQCAYGGVQLGQTSYAYDTQGRVASASDARNGTTVYQYDAMDRVTRVITPPPGTGQGPQTTSTFYDNLGRVWQDQSKRQATADREAGRMVYRSSEMARTALAFTSSVRHQTGSRKNI